MIPHPIVITSSTPQENRLNKTAGERMVSLGCKNCPTPREKSLRVVPHNHPVSDLKESNYISSALFIHQRKTSVHNLDTSVCVNISLKLMRVRGCGNAGGDCHRCLCCQFQLQIQQETIEGPIAPVHSHIHSIRPETIFQMFNSSRLCVRCVLEWFTGVCHWKLKVH